MRQTANVFWVGVCGVGILLGIYIRCVVAQEPLWLDELHTGWVVKEDFSSVAQRANIGNQPPLYFWLVAIVTQLGGLTELNLRLISLISGFLILPVSGLLVWRWTKQVAMAALTIGVLSVDATMIFYASEARPYALLQLIGLVQIWTLRNLITTFRDERYSLQQSFLFVFLSALMFYLHYTSALVLMAEAVLVALMLFRDRDGNGSNRFREWAVLAFAVFVAIMPAIANLRLVWKRKGNWQTVSSIEQLWNDLFPAAMILVLLPLVWMGFCRLLTRSPKKPEPSPMSRFDIVLLFSCAVLPPLAVFLVDYSQFAGLALLRYVVLSYLMVVVFGFVCIANSGNRTLRIGLGAVMATGLIMTNPFAMEALKTRSVPLMRHENWSDPIEQINELGEFKSLPVFQLANVLEDVDANKNPDTAFQNYLLFPTQGIYFIDDSSRQIMAAPTLIEPPFDERHFELIKGQGGAWLLIRATRPHAKFFLEYLERSYPEELVYNEFSSPDSNVLLYLVRSSASPRIND